MLIELWFSLVLPTARRRRVRYGIELCDTGCAEHQAHARAFRSLSAQPAGEIGLQKAFSYILKGLNIN